MADEGRPSFSGLTDALCEWADQRIGWHKPSMQRLNVQLCAQPLLGAVLLWLESRGQAALAARLERMYQALVQEAADFDALYGRQASTITDAGDEDARYREFDAAMQSLQGGAHGLAETLRAVDSLLVDRSLPGTDAEAEPGGRLQDLDRQLARGQEVLTEQLRAARTASEALEAAMEATRNRSGGQKATSRKERRVDWLAKAFLLVSEHPDWPDREIAEKVGKDPSTLSRCHEYRVAAGLARCGTSSIRPGYRDARTGNIEAVGDGIEDDADL